MRIASARWWFENRQTGELTIAQFPNWPLFAIAGGWGLRLVLPDSSPAVDVIAVVTVALWLYWGADELLRGVNPWRRVLGVGVITWQVAGLVG